jgi:hypothetical protein
MRHLLQEAAHFFTHFDGAFFKTVRLLFTQPGFVSAEYVHGIRKKHFKPLSLFLLCVVLYLLFPAFSGLNMKFTTYLSDNFEYRGLVKNIAEKKAAAKNISLTELSEMYDARSGKVSKILLLLYLPLSAFMLFGIFFRQRKYFFDHFILSAELNSFLIAFGFLLLPFILYTGNSFGILFLNEITIRFIIGGAFLAVILIAFKRFYRKSWVWTVIKSLLFLAVFLFIINPL